MAVSAVIGLGYVGLPFLLCMARAGHRAIGVDVNPEKIASLLSGEADLEKEQMAELGRLVQAGTVTLTTSFAAAAEAEFVSICVPTPLDAMKTPDLRFVVAAAEATGRYLRPGQTVILESTTYPGTTEDLVRPILESSGLRAGRDFYLGYSPERVDPGNTRYSIRNTPKVVGADDRESLERICSFYGSFIERIVPLPSSRAAEMTKLLENTFRAVNIAFINEMAIMAERLEINIWEVIGAAGTKPFGFMPFYPGPGIGGHCIPLDPLYLSWKAKSVNFFSRFIDTAADVNNNMPHHVRDRVLRIAGQLGKRPGAIRLLLLGVAYKPDVRDARESPGRELFELLQNEGLHVEYHDPLVPTLAVAGRMRTSTALDRLEEFDCVVALVRHSAFDLADIQRRARLIYDTRNMFPGTAENVLRLGDGTWPIADVLAGRRLYA
jgi:UDP-N-acetyl-D-glucosamine dehydrogenase